ncbi:SRPBCC family protein [Amycolatopsis sulphurea]|uniref:hypothetical protein n=1 Tax=Amycolatopsis sulphurea TaxID=76022 RepID=UPI001B80B8FA|nr:hypothetical protein [Amycolatopsis sulphurea]
MGETVVTIAFAGRDGKTKMTFHQAPFPNEAEREGHRHGGAVRLRGPRRDAGGEPMTATRPEIVSEKD